MAGCALPTIPRPSEGSAPVSTGRVAVGDTLVHPCVHLGQNPRNSVGAKLYPLGEFARRFEARNVLGCVWDAADGPQLLLRYEPLVVLSHRISPSQGGIAMPRVEQAAPVGAKKVPCCARVCRADDAGVSVTAGAVVT